MARQYSHRQFFRQVPNNLLGRYFHEKHDILQEIAFDQLKETEVEPIFQAFTALPFEQQSEIEAEFQDIDTMSCQGGVTALTDEADYHGDQEFPEALAKIEGFHGKVMWTFLEHPKYWAGATLFLHSDNISDSLWKKRNDLPHLPPHVDPEDTERLEQAISQYFHKKEGRGRNCKVEVFRRHEKEYFFAYPEDFAQSDVEWISKALRPRARHPAFEIIFVYTQVEGSLDIYAPRNTKSVPKLQQIFADNILGLEKLDEFGGDNRVYVLDALADRDFVFKYPAGCGIESVLVRHLRLSLKTGDKRRVTVEANPSDNPKAVYDLMEQLKLPPFHVTQAEIKVTFHPTPGTRRRTRTFKISYPNWCALRHDGRDLVIRKMLADSGIEPMKPEST
ncbi:MAG: hypothetical protein ACE5EK_03085 [Nitrospinales bacterium]